mmetsp:Transcript_2246/g.8932  ORF Transcript_2246/g.8932 Transcript_2246/m.8932 type:complete len:341 (-) Transcript_2246:1294-2316(-)
MVVSPDAGSRTIVIESVSTKGSNSHAAGGSGGSSIAACGARPGSAFSGMRGAPAPARRAKACRSRAPVRRATPVEHPSPDGLMHKAVAWSAPADGHSSARRPLHHPSAPSTLSPARSACARVALSAVDTRPAKAARVMHSPVATLSMQSIDASGPGPVCATPMASHARCRRPSSPGPPCTAMKTTARIAAASSSSAPSVVRSGEALASTESDSGGSASSAEAAARAARIVAARSGSITASAAAATSSTVWRSTVPYGRRSTLRRRSASISPPCSHAMSCASSMKGRASTSSKEESLSHAFVPLMRDTWRSLVPPPKSTYTSCFRALPFAHEAAVCCSASA